MKRNGFWGWIALAILCLVLTGCNGNTVQEGEQVRSANSGVVEGEGQENMVKLATLEPTEAPTPEPTEVPTPEPTEAPTPEPTEAPTPEPTEVPTPEPTETPILASKELPTPEPVQEPALESIKAYAVNNKNGKIHMVGKCSATGTGKNAMEEPVYFSTYEEAEAYSASRKPNLEKRKCGNCW